MSIEELYDRVISKKYDEDPFGLRLKTREIAFDQIKRHPTGKKILDLAMGTAEALVEIKNIFPQAEFYGIDISQKMIDLAKKKMEITTFHDDARNIGKYLKPKCIDLALLYFALAYFKFEDILEKVSPLLCRSGLLSVATTTYGSFPYIHDNSVKIGVMSEENIRSGSWVPQDINTIKESLKGTNFELLEAQTIRQEICFNNYNELYEFGMQAGWLTQFFSKLNVVQIGIIKALEKKLFPFSDQFEALIFLMRKKD